MLKKTLFALTLIGVTTILIYATKPPEKEYVVKMSFSDWNLVVLSINSPDDVTKNQKAAVLTKMIAQINQQMIDTLPKIK